MHLILYVNDDDSPTGIDHPDRKLAWIMTRSPKIDEATYATLREERVKRDIDLSEPTRAAHR